MSFFNEANEDAMSIAPDTAATGPRVGFLESFEVGYNAQVRASAFRGIENEMYKIDDEQVRAMRRAGIEDAPGLATRTSLGLPTSMFEAVQDDAYLDTARFYADGGEPEFATRLKEYDDKIGKLRELYPQLNLKTSREMFDTVKAEAQSYEARASNDRRTFGGSVGSFLGGAVGGFNPASDPLNVVTAPIGGSGKTVATRIAGQAGAQGLIEGVNQLTGVQEQRRLLGLDYGLTDAVMRVGGAVVGGAALQGIGEGVVMGARRFFRSTPNDPAPLPDVLDRPSLPDTRQVPPQAIPADETLAAAKLTRNPESYVDYLHEQSPFSASRSGRARTVLDLDYVTERLQAWDGDTPVALKPKTDTAVTLPTNDFIAPDLTRIAERSTVDDIARSVDPQTFRKYDAIATQKQQYKARMEELQDNRNTDTQTAVDDLDKRIYDLTAKLETETGKRAAKVRKDIQALQVEKENVISDAAARGVETPEVQRMRRNMMVADEKMRDLAPLVSRAYARAQNKWANTEADRVAISTMMREGNTAIGEVDSQAARIADAVELQLSDRAPILRDAPRVQGKLKQDADAADVAAAIVADNMKIIDEGIEAYRASLDRLIAIDKNGDIEIQGQSYKLNLDKDKIVVPNEEGTGGREITIRELLEENKASEHELEAVQTCSLRKTS